jgi:hypothetical protein
MITRQQAKKATDARVAVLESAVSALKAQCAEKDAQLSELEDAYKDKCTQHVTLINRHVNMLGNNDALFGQEPAVMCVDIVKDNRIAELEAMCDAKDVQIGHLVSKCAEKDSSIANCEDGIATMYAQLRAMTDKYTALLVANDSLVIQSADVGERARFLEQEYAAIHALKEQKAPSPSMFLMPAQFTPPPAALVPPIGCFSEEMFNALIASAPMPSAASLACEEMLMTVTSPLEMTQALSAYDATKLFLQMHQLIIERRTQLSWIYDDHRRLYLYCSSSDTCMRYLSQTYNELWDYVMSNGVGK